MKLRPIREILQNADLDPITYLTCIKHKPVSVIAKINIFSPACVFIFVTARNREAKVLW
jgi:hypothetical protein